MKFRQTLRQAGLVLLAALAMLAVLALLSLILMLAGQAFADVFWRLCSALAGIAMLAGAVLLLTDRRQNSAKWPLWKEHFPNLPFSAAVLIVAFVLAAAAGIVNYLVW